MSKFKKGDKVEILVGDIAETGWVENIDAFVGKTYLIDVERPRSIGEGVEYWLEGVYWFFPEECLVLVEEPKTTKKHTYTGEWIDIDEQIPPFGVEVFLYLPEEFTKRQKGSLKYIGEDGPIFKKTGQTNPFSTANNFPKIVGRVVMWTEAPSLPNKAYNE